MKNRWLHLLILTGIGTFGMTGCVESHRAWVREPATRVNPGGEVVVSEEPPPPQREEVGVAPDETHVWVAGYWSYADRNWVWIPGHWEVRPRADAVWVPGQWNKSPVGRGWTWTPGHWE